MSRFASDSPGRPCDNVGMADDDPFNLRRFIAAQEPVYDEALAEIRSGRKRTHWMWYVFPQLDGLGSSSTAKFYAIKSIEEAQAYLSHPVLGERLRECVNALLAIDGRSASAIFGYPDDLKLRSCATLFAALPNAESIFTELLTKYFDGAPDQRTLDLLRLADNGNPRVRASRHE